MEANIVLSTNPGKFTVVQLHQEELTHLQDLCVRCEDFIVLTTGQKPGPNEAQEQFMECPPGKSPKDKTILGLFHGKVLVGAMELLQDYPERGIWYIGLMLLDPSFRGQGLGKELLTWVERWLRARDVAFLRIAVLDINPRGKNFWLSNGFSQINTVKDYASGSLVTQAHVLEKKLTN